MDILKRRKKSKIIIGLLYSNLAFKFDVKSTSVERAIRYAIELAWKRGELKERNKRPTNTEFFKMLVNRVAFKIEMFETEENIKSSKITSGTDFRT